MKPIEGPMRWYYEPWVVLVCLFLVLGPFGLPLVYKSPKFNKLSKIVLTVLMVIYTGYLVSVTAKTILAIKKTLPELQTLLG